MPSYADAVNTTLSNVLENGTRVYTGHLDAFYSIGAVPQGGYILGFIIDAVVRHQAETSHPDPIHVSAHYLEPSSPGAVEIRIKEQRTGRRFWNITADLYQEGKMNVTTHIIVGTLPDPANVSKDRSMPTILPPHPYATRIPFRTHPRRAKRSEKPAKLTFGRFIEIAEDEVINARQIEKGKNPLESGGGFDSAKWYQFLDQPDNATRGGLAAITFLADMGKSTPEVLPVADQPGESWFPTMSFQLEFKVKLSALPSYIAPHTFGVWSTGRFLIEGRHELHTEVWTAPSEITTDGQISANDPKWREKMFCVARSTQMAITVPLEVNRRKVNNNQPETNDNGSEKAKL